MPKMPGRWNGAPNPLWGNWARLYNNQTLAETALEPAVAKLGRPYRFQHIVSNRYICDFALPLDMVILEVDGPSHNTKAARAVDQKRTEFLNERGWTVVRCQNKDAIRDPEGEVNRMMEEAGLPYRANV